MQTTTKSLFGMAKKTETKKKKDAKEGINIAGIATDIDRYNSLKSEIESREAELTLIEDKLKSVGKEKFLECYEEQKKRPESFKLVDTLKVKKDDGTEEAQEKAVLLIVQDKYLSVDEEKVEVLSCHDDLVETTETYTFNPEVLGRCGDVLSELIMNCDKISEQDKENLLVKTEKHTVKKGTIDRLCQYENPREIFSLVQPIVMLKRCK